MRSSSLGAETKHEWLLIKHRDAWSRPDDAEVVDQTSVLSGLTVEELGAGESRSAPVIERLEELGAPRRGVTGPDIELMLATVADAPFSRRGWLFELKYDGYRLLAEKRQGRATLYYRSGIVATDVFPEVARAVTALPFDRLILDGEVTVPDAAGKPSFSRLQKRGRLSRAPDISAAAVHLPAAYFCFDLLAFEGFDLRGMPLHQRKQALQGLLPASGSLRYADHVEERGEALYEQVVKMGLEGLLAKKAGGRYRGGRSASWQKIRAEKVDDFVIVGCTAPQGTRTGFGALHMAAYAASADASEDEDSDDLVYVGRVGSGFSDRQLEQLVAILEATAIDSVTDLHMSGPVPDDVESTWVEPSLIGEVRYKEITEDGHLRQPVFLRLRRDKPLHECLLPLSRAGAEAPGRIGGIGVGAPRLQLSNLDKVFWPAEGFTKGDLLDYYEAVGELLLPYLAERPLVLDRYPDGIEGKNFFQKDAPGFVPSWVRTTPIDEGEGKRNNYLICDSVESLLYIINLGAIPLHVWSSRR